MSLQLLSYDSFPAAARHVPRLKFWAALAGGLLLFWAGCSRPDATDSSAAKTPPSDVKLRLLVIDDPAMAAAIGQLKGEWNGQTGSTLEVQEAKQLEPDAANPPDVDAILLPSDQICLPAEKMWLASIPKTLTQDRRGAGLPQSADQGSEDSGWGELFSLLRTHEAVWGAEVVGVPFGSPVLTCYYRADLLEKLGAKPPRTWAEYRKLAELLADRKRLGDAAPPEGSPWFGALESLGPGWAGLDLLARAAPYVAHRSNYSALFKIDSMEPLIDSPPFVKALEDLVAVARSGATDSLKHDPAAVRRAFWQGQCGMALTWPTAADKSLAKEGPKLRVGFVELPGSADVYNVSAGAWEKRQADEDSQVPLLGIAGRTGVVTKGSKSPEMAFRLLLWLSGEHWNRQVCAVSPATTMFRRSDLKSPLVWVEKPVSPSSAAQYAILTQKTLNRERCLLALRIPGRAEYLGALDEAVQQAIQGQKPPEEALRQAARRWREITQRLGLERQRETYQHSLGL